MPAHTTRPPRHSPPAAPTTTSGAFDLMTTPFDADDSVDLKLHEIDPPAVGGLTATVPRGGGRAALVVDSTPVARKFLAQRLQSLGYEVQMAEGGDEALAMVGQQRFAIVFTELALAPERGLDGLNLCQAIKQMPDHANGIAPAVVIATGGKGASDRVRGSLAGCDAYLLKPLLEAPFLAALAEVDPLFR